MQAAAQAYLEAMPVYTRKEFDKLPQVQKSRAFTITAARNTEASLSRIRSLKALIVMSLTTPNEAEAWRKYKAEAKTVMGEQEFNIAAQDLAVSFRYARQSAYNAGIDAQIRNNAGSVWGVRVQTQEDSRVRSSHRRLNGIIRPPDDPIWDVLRFPLGFNCRCYRVPISALQAEQEGLSFTPEKDIPKVKPFK